jgi:HlyD family secretion protein
MGRKLIFLRLGALALVGVFILSACNSKETAEAHDKSPSAPASPFAAIANGKVDVEGGLIEIDARRFGMVRDVLVQEGAIVKKGQVLARQDDQDSLLAVDNAKANLVQAQSQIALIEVNLRTAQREYNRLKQLAGFNAIALQQLDQASDSIATAEAQMKLQQAAIQTARTQLAQAAYNEELTIIRAPMDGKIVRRYANPGSGASTLNISPMFDLEPEVPHIIRAEIIESAIPEVHVGQEAEISSESDGSKIFAGKVIRIAATFGTRKNKSEAATEATDERVVEVVVSANETPYLIGQRVMVKFKKLGARTDSVASTAPS